MGRADNTAAERDRRIAVPDVQHTPDWRGLCSESAGLNQTRWSRCGDWFSGPISTRAFLLRRIDRVAGGVNAFLIAMALGLGMLDLAYTIDKLLAALPPH